MFSRRYVSVFQQSTKNGDNAHANSKLGYISKGLNCPCAGRPFIFQFWSRIIRIFYPARIHHKLKNVRPAYFFLSIACAQKRTFVFKDWCLRGSRVWGRGPGPSQPHPSCHHWENPKDYQLIKQSKNKSRNPVLPSTNKISHWTPLERSSRTARTHIGYIYAIKDNCTI